MSDELERFRGAWKVESRPGHAGRDVDEGSNIESAGELWVERTRRLDRDRLRSRVREIAISALAVGILVGAIPWLPEPWLRAWSGLLAFVAGLLAVRKYGLAFGQGRDLGAESLVVHCRSELAKLESEIFLQRTLVWWYLLPILIGTHLYIWWFSADRVSESLVVLPSTLGIVVAIGFCTRRSLGRVLLPRREELARCLAELEAVEV